MASRTLWQQLYDDPGHPAHWDAFLRHYSPRVYRWALRALRGNGQAAEEVTENVFQNLYRRITDPAAARVRPAGGSCAPFVFQAVQHACTDYHRDAERQARLTDEMRDHLRSDQSRRDLEGVIAEAERAEEWEALGRRVEDLYPAYVRAVRLYKATQRTAKERGQSWAVFLAAYAADPRDGLGAELDRAFGFPTRGYALKAAHRVAAALLRDMGLPTDDDCWDESELFLRVLVRRYGDPPD